MLTALRRFFLCQGMELKMEQATVSVSHVAKRFGQVQAVRDVSFEVYPGEIFGLLGPNGAGKTTTIRVMLDIFKADAGKVTIFGEPFSESVKDRIGYLPEERGLYRDQTLEQMLPYFAALKGVPEGEARQRMEIWLKRFDLWEDRTKKTQELSKGMQQKAQIVATLLHEPDLVVIDEPFSGLDPVNTRLVKEVIQELQEAGKTVIMSTHQMYQVEMLCNRILLIDKGEGVLYGKLADIKREYSGNSVLVSGQGELGELVGVLEMRRQNGDYHLVLDDQTTPEDVLKQLVGRDDFKLEQYQVTTASLEDIFVQVVQGKKE